MKILNLNKGFTLIELIVVIAIIIILYGVILFCVTLYINSSKDANIRANLAILIPAGEVYYNVGNNYGGFCDPSTNSVFKNAISQLPVNSSGSCSGNVAGICCYVGNNSNAWVAFAKEFTDSSKIYCVDSRGMKEDTSSDNATSIENSLQCP